MSFDSLDISLIVFTVSALVQAAWMIAVGRTLQGNGKSGAARVGVRLAGLCLCMLLPSYVIAVLDMAGWRIELFRHSLLLFSFAAIPALVLASASSIGWGSGRWGSGDPGPIFFWGFLFTVVATAILWAGMSDMHRGLDGPPVEAGYTIVPCALWHLITGPWLMRWAQRHKLSSDLCLNCEYDLAGLPAQVPCPECGTARARPNQIVDKGAPPSE